MRSHLDFQGPSGLDVAVAEGTFDPNPGVKRGRGFPPSILEGADGVDGMPPGMGGPERQDITSAKITDLLLNPAILAIEPI